jgi:hypothetical protein
VQGKNAYFCKVSSINKREREREREIQNSCKDLSVKIASSSLVVIYLFLGDLSILFAKKLIKNLQGQWAQGLWENSAGVRLRTLTAVYAII